MPALDYRIDTAVTADSAAAIGQAANRLEAVLGELDGYVGTVSGLWEGEAQGAYLDIQNQWDQGAEQIREIMQQIMQALQEITESAEQVETRNRGLFG